jgi:hypothetical protein
MNVRGRGDRKSGKQLMIVDEKGNLTNMFLPWVTISKQSMNNF